MTSNILSSCFSAFLRENSKYRALANREIVKKTVRELVNGPYILRFHLNDGDRIYFVGDDENYFHFKGKGKNVRWLHDFFEGIRQDLIEKGFPPSKSIYDCSIETVFTHKTVLTIFPGATFIPEKEVQEMNKKGYFDTSERAEVGEEE